MACVLKMKTNNGFLSPIFVLIIFQILFLVTPKTVVVSELNYSDYREVSSLRLARIEKHLDKINKPALLTIQSPDGDIIDCVHKRKQPALDHPLLKNHKIQRVAPEWPKKVMRDKEMRESDTNIQNGSSISSNDAWQSWHQKGQRCPRGTIPVRRSLVHDVLRAKSLYHFGKKRRASPETLSRRVDAPDVVSGNGHEHAIAYTGASQEVYGARATINVWEPKIEVVNEFSLSQIWVLSGSFDGSDLNSIEAGWQSG